MRTPIAVLASLSFVSSLLGQSFPVGYRDVGITNATNAGSRSLAVRIHYPAKTTGKNTTLRAQKGGYPVVVFLHGLTLPASDYDRFGATLASNGFVAVMNDTARTDADLQVLDGIALYLSLATENKRTASTFTGAFDMSRAGIAGHSMGGGSTVRVLAANPGYKAGLCFAPWDGQIFGGGPDWTKTSPKVKTPLCVLHGRGDWVVNWKSSGRDFYTNASNYTGVRAFVLLDSSASHSNIVKLGGSPSSTDLAINKIGLALGLGWFERHLRGSSTGLEDVLGNAVRKFSNFDSLLHEYRTPELWHHGSVQLGGTGSVSLGGEAGNGAIYVALGTKTVTLPFGTLQLDPSLMLPVVNGKLTSSRLLRINTKVPNLISLINQRLWFQAITDGAKPGLQLTRAFTVQITK